MPMAAAARYYDASLGRYIQSDPIGLGGGAAMQVAVPERDTPVILRSPSTLA